MAHAFEALYEWSKRVADARVDENDVTVVIGAGQTSREATSHNCTVRGVRDGVTVVVTFNEYYQAADPIGQLRGARRNVLDVFAADAGSPLECVVRRKNGWEKVLAFFRRRPPAHPLFATCVVEVGADERCRRILAHVSFLDAVHVRMRQPCFLRLEFQAGTGVTALCRVDPATLSADVVDSVVQGTADVLHAASQAARG